MPDLSPSAAVPPDLKLRILVALAFGAWFWIVYFGCDLLAQNFTHRFSVRTFLDDRLPFVPSLGPAYLLINPLLLLPVLLLRRTGDVAAFAATLAVEVAIAGICFLAFPVEEIVTPAHASRWLRVADAVNLTFNNFPSLHVALAVSAGLGLGPELRRPARWLLWFVVALVAASTVLTRQHFLADAAAGALLALVAMRLVFPALRPWAARRLKAGVS